MTLTDCDYCRHFVSDPLNCTYCTAEKTMCEACGYCHYCHYQSLIEI